MNKQTTLEQIPEDSYFEQLRKKTLAEEAAKEKEPFIDFLQSIWPFSLTKDLEPVLTENLNYVPADAGPLLEEFHSDANRGLGFKKTVKKKYEDFEGKGAGTLYLSDRKGVPTFTFYPTPPKEWMDEQNRKIAQIGTIAHAPMYLAPFAMAAGVKNRGYVPQKLVMEGSKKFPNTKLEIPISPKGLKDAKLLARNLNQVESVYNRTSTEIQLIKNFANQNGLSIANAEKYLDQFKPYGLIKEKTSGSLKENSLFSPNYRPPNLMFKEDNKLTSSSMGDDIFGGVKRNRNEPYPDYVKRILISNGAEYDDAGNLIMYPEKFFAIKNANVRREVAQLILTDIDQGVKGSFLAQKKVKNPELNKALERYNKKYAAHADLHHGYPSVIGIEFFLGIPLWGKTWRSQMQVAATHNNFPGQPMVEGKDNLVSLPSSVPSTQTRKWGPVTKVQRKNPIHKQAKDALEKEGRKIPQHLHQIIHDAFLTNEMGQKGQKFWKKWDPIIMRNPQQGWIDAYEDFNDIISRNRAIYNEGIAQLEAIFSNNPLSENPAKIVDMLEEYVAKGKVSIGKGIVRGKDGRPVILKKGDDTTLSTVKTVEYSQDAVKYELEDALLGFKKALRDERINQDPRFKDVTQEIHYFPKLTDKERLRMEELLYDIQWYHSIFITDGARRAWHVTGITKKLHKSNIKEYNDLMQPKLFKLPEGLPRPKIDSEEKLQTTTFKDVKPNKEQMLQLILDLHR